MSAELTCSGSYIFWRGAGSKLPYSDREILIEIRLRVILRESHCQDFVAQE